VPSNSGNLEKRAAVFTASSSPAAATTNVQPLMKRPGPDSIVRDLLFDDGHYKRASEPGQREQRVGAAKSDLSLETLPHFIEPRFGKHYHFRRRDGAKPFLLEQLPEVSKSSLWPRSTASARRRCTSLSEDVYGRKHWWIGTAARRALRNGDPIHSRRD
jgi:hypothetical protein